MLDKKKIHLMTNLAIYDDESGYKDKQINRYFKSDYIGKKLLINNTIFSIFSLIITGVIFLNFVIFDESIVGTNHLKIKVIEYGVYFTISLVLYTIFNIYIYSKKYDQAVKNMEKYYLALNKLDKIN